jgi:peptide deformylase
MALRDIVIINKDKDGFLRKQTREVKNITPHILMLLDDMTETLTIYNGVGISAPQIHVLRKLVVIKINDKIIEFINPVIIDQNGSSMDIEGCLSIPYTNGKVERPEEITVEYMDRYGEMRKATASGIEARAICHEIDHLNGILFVDKMVS